MGTKQLRTGKRKRPKTVVRGRRYRCAICKKRTNERVLFAPYYCPKCVPMTRT